MSNNTPHWLQEWYTRWRDEGLSEDEFPLEELPIVHESDEWEVWKCWRRTACENTIGDSKIWVNAPPGTYIDIEHEYGTGQAFDHPDIWGVVDEHGFLWWYNAERVPTHMKMFVDGELLIERIRFDLGNEYCRRGLFGWRPTNRSGQYVYDIVVIPK